MAARTDIATKVVIGGKPYTVFMVDNPTIEDVMVVEMKLWAANKMNRVSDSEYRVSRGVRDTLIRLGVER
jgi:hypothetical protein